jgi:peptidyl-prolyl cis-trans isomerase D
MIPRTVTAADSQATLARMAALRDEIADGARFEDVAMRESQDETNASAGGSLGMRGREAFDSAFESAAYALQPGQVSQPVLTPFGYHLIRVDERKGDSISARHILLRVGQSESNAVATDRRADSLSRIAAATTEPERFDSAAKSLGLTPTTVTAYEGQPLFTGFGLASGASAWAFGGAQAGETSDLFDTEDAYFLARLDTLQESGVAPFGAVRPEIEALLMSRRKSEVLAERTREFAERAKATSLETAAQERTFTVNGTNLFSRSTFVPGLGRLTGAVGAAFALPVGQVSAPIATDDGVYVIRVDRRVEARREAFEAQKEVQRSNALAVLQQSRVRDFMDGLREQANIRDRRKALNAAARAQAVAQ